MTTKTLKLNNDEAVEYLRNNAKIHDKIEISYNRIFAEGEILNIDFSEYFGKPGFKMLIILENDSTNPTIELDLDEIKDDLIEFHHFPKKKDDVFVTIV